MSGDLGGLRRALEEVLREVSEGSGAVEGRFEGAEASGDSK